MMSTGKYIVLEMKSKSLIEVLQFQKRCSGIQFNYKVRPRGRPPAAPAPPAAPRGNYPLQMLPYADVFGRSRDLLAAGRDPPATSVRPRGRPPAAPPPPGRPQRTDHLQTLLYADVFGRSRDLLSTGRDPPATSVRPRGRPPALGGGNYSELEQLFT